jgi:hypothetical protein
MAQKMRKIVVAGLPFGVIIIPVRLMLYRDAGAKPSGEMPRHLTDISIRSPELRHDAIATKICARATRPLAKPPRRQIMPCVTLLGETGSIRCRRSNRPGNSQANGPQGVDCTLERGLFPKRAEPKG